MTKKGAARYGLLEKHDIAPGWGGAAWEGLLQRYLAAEQLPIWFSNQELTGSVTAVNKGSLGAAGNGTITNATLQQTGVLGVNHAFGYDGLSTRVIVAANAGHASLTQWTKIIILNPSGLGEGGAGFFMHWNGGGHPNFAIGGAASLLARVTNTVPTNFDTTTGSGLTLDDWALVAATYDDAGDRKIHIYKGDINGFDELAYSAQPALTDTLSTSSVQLTIGNTSSFNRTLLGDVDEALVFNVALTKAVLEALYSCLPFG